jgi:hypothetical protein
MMRLTYKLLTAALLVANFAIAIPVSAERGRGADALPETERSLAPQTPRPEKKTEKQNCTQFANGLNKLNSKAGEKSKAVDATHKDRQDNVVKKSQERTTEIDKTRSASDVKREEAKTELLSKATTPEQKAAVEKYSASLKAAILVRRQAVDVARAQFQTDLDALIGNNGTAQKEAYAAYLATLESAFSTALADCEAGKDLNTVREAHKNTVKTAREAFKKANEGKKDNKAAIAKILDARKKAVGEAKSAFQKTMDAARTELKSVLKS